MELGKLRLHAAFFPVHPDQKTKLGHIKEKLQNWDAMIFFFLPQVCSLKKKPATLDDGNEENLQDRLAFSRQTLTQDKRFIKKTF